LLHVDDLEARYRTAIGERRKSLAVQISEAQIEINALTIEANVCPGANRFILGRVQVRGLEAYQAAQSILAELLEHRGQAGAERSYEIYKYMERFAKVTRLSGVDLPGLDSFESLGEFVNRDREAMKLAVESPGAGPGKAMSKALLDAKIDEFLGFAGRAMGEIRERAFHYDWDWEAGTVTTTRRSAIDPKAKLEIDPAYAAELPRPEPTRREQSGTIATEPQKNKRQQQPVGKRALPSVIVEEQREPAPLPRRRRGGKIGAAALIPGENKVIVDPRLLPRGEIAKARPHPSVPPRFTSLREFGKAIRWGAKWHASLRNMDEIDPHRLRALGLTRQLAREWRDFYIEEAERVPDNPSAHGRAAFMTRVVQVLDDRTIVGVAD
jgi:hypothetical protein